MKVETFKITDLRQLALHMAKARLDELAITQQGMSIRMRFRSSPFVANNEVPTQETTHLTTPSSLEQDLRQPVLAQGPGYFLRHHPTHHQEYISQGSIVKAGDMLGVVKMGQIYLPIYSPLDGEVVEVMATESQVEYGQTVIVLKDGSTEARA
ncbi:acetyl-CoA carboxylase biotin carboxyl carrier protein [Tatumella ptyseos]|uniref:acetyl-CoA carboxylase biotin carboxyl carrier protein n=1 Tax=Tatumella ptyseos TaxID=82987 RepID=UPI0026F03C2F|nr:hypothetical protein [Tatumella ptyseos]WKX26987.1 hypothetical protein QJR74_02230 [Tatumella ptyseos]